MVPKGFLRLSDTPHTPKSPLMIDVEVFVLRLSLTQTHVLHVSHEQFHLVVSDSGNAVQLFVGILIIHLQDADKREIVQGFGLTRIIAVGSVPDALRIDLCRVEVSIVVRIGNVVQLVSLVCAS
jgi:hypothetical protein